MELYDKETGQVYIETTQPVRSMVSWAITSRRKREDPMKFRNSSPGATSLQAMALRSCIWNAECFEPDTLKYAGWHYTERLLRTMKHTDTLSFAAWSIFRVAFPEEVDRNFHVYFPERCGSYPNKLASIVDRLSKISFECLSFLSIRNLQLRSHHLMSLLSVPNLAFLSLEQEPVNVFLPDDGNITDKFMRDWGRAACERGAFKKLKVLVLRHFSPDMESTVKGITMFPVLHLINIDSRRIRYGSKKVKPGQLIQESGWRYLNTDGSEQRSSLYENPETVWKRADITSQHRMEILYNLANKYLQQPLTEATKEGYISIDYGDAIFRDDPRSLSAWFVRVPTSVRELAISTKRYNDASELSKSSRADPAKRRKIKEGKRKDIGSFLGAFG